MRMLTTPSRFGNEARRRLFSSSSKSFSTCCLFAISTLLCCYVVGLVSELMHCTHPQRTSADLERLGLGRWKLLHASSGLLCELRSCWEDSALDFKAEGAALCAHAHTLLWTLCLCMHCFDGFGNSYSSAIHQCDCSTLRS